MSPRPLPWIASLCAACSSSLGGTPDMTLDRPPGMDTVRIDRELPDEDVGPLDAGPRQDHEDAGGDAFHGDATDVAHDADDWDADVPNANDGDLRDAVASDLPQDVPRDGSRCGGPEDSYYRSCSHCSIVDTIVTVACQRPDFQRCHIYSVDCIDDDFVQCWRTFENPGLAEGCRAFCARARDAGITSCSFH